MALVGIQHKQHHTLTKLLGDIGALETKGRGKKANDKRPYTQLEFEKLLELLRNKEDFDQRYKFSMMTL